jgi:hypothetical protein
MKKRSIQTEKDENKEEGSNANGKPKGNRSVILSPI